MTWDLKECPDSPPALVMGQGVLVFEKGERGIDEKDLQKAAEELREDENTKKQALEEFKKLIAQTENIYLPLDDEEADLYLSAYLRTCKYYVNSAFDRLRKQWHFRSKYSDYFGGILPSTGAKAFERNLITILPSRDQHGRRMLILHMGSRWKPSECSLVDMVRSAVLTVETAILEVKTQISGTVLIVDMENVKMLQVLQISPKFARIIACYIQDVAPIRLKAIHIVKQPPLFNIAYKIFKPFINEKLSSRLHMHGYDEESLTKHIDPKYLPFKYGGIMDIPLNMGSHQVNFLRNFDEIFQRTSKYGLIGKTNKSKK